VIRKRSCVVWRRVVGKVSTKITRWQPILLHVPFCRAVGGVTRLLTLIHARCFYTFPFPTPTEEQKQAIRPLASNSHFGKNEI